MSGTALLNINCKLRKQCSVIVLSTQTLQILQEAVQCSNADACEDAAMASTDVQRQAALLVEQLRERQSMVASGQLDLENGFDDFRVVLGDAGL